MYDATYACMHVEICALICAVEECRVHFLGSQAEQGPPPWQKHLRSEAPVKPSQVMKLSLPPALAKLPLEYRLISVKLSSRLNLVWLVATPASRVSWTIPAMQPFELLRCRCLLWASLAAAVHFPERSTA